MRMCIYVYIYIHISFNLEIISDLQDICNDKGELPILFSQLPLMLAFYTPYTKL